MGRKLTNAAVEKFTCGVFRTGKHKGEPKPQDTLWCGELRGFGMRLTASTGRRAYIIRYRVKGEKEPRFITIGHHNDPWRVDDARAEALDLKRKMRAGIDPIAEAKREREAQAKLQALEGARQTTLRQVMTHYLVNKRTKHGPLRPKTKKSIARACMVDLLDLLDKPIAELTRDKCLAKFTTLSSRSESVANQAMVYLRALCNHAREMHATEDGEYPVLPVNPVTRMTKLRKLNPTRSRKTRIPLARVGAVWSMLRRRHADARNVIEQTACDWVCFMLLTGCRLTESGSLKKSNVSLEARTITLPGDVDEAGGFAGTKNHNPMVWPMSGALYDILSARLDPPQLKQSGKIRPRRTPYVSEYVFPSWGRKSPFITDARATMDAVSAVAGCHISPHALRRTAEDIAKEVKIDPDERRQLLNHLAEDVHGISYSNNPDPEVLRHGVEAIARWIVEQSVAAEKKQTKDAALQLAEKKGNIKLDDLPERPANMCT